MTASITPSTDGKYVDVFVPIAFKKFGGRKTIVAPDGTQLLAGRSKATDSTLTKALARAWRWQQLLDAGIYSSIAEMADKEGINRSYLSRTIRLALLAPDIVEAILNGTQPATLQLSALEQPFPIDWEAQRKAFGFRANASAVEHD
jgi:hypothetical protein